MSAKDYMIAHTPFESYIVKRTKNTTIMSMDRRPLTEYECTEIAYQYLKRKLAGTDHNVLTVSIGNKPVLRMQLLDKKGGDDE